MPKKSNRSSFGRDFGGDVMDMARDRPFATAAVAAATVGAGVFLWSRRNQISDQLNDLSNQIREWTQTFPLPDDSAGIAEAGEATDMDATSRGTGRMSEAGGGNGGPGARTGGSGTTGSISGRGRAKSTTPQATR
jgi:hypothetical protein